MASVHDRDNFRGRVELAASYISAGRNCTRSFDTCFEMWDGDAVGLALYRRAQKNPDGALARNFSKYLGGQRLEEVVRKYAGVPDKHLAKLAASLRLEGERESRLERYRWASVGEQMEFYF